MAERRSRSPERRLSLSRGASPVPTITMSDAEYSKLKNSEKRSHNKRLRAQELTMEMRHLRLTQQLYEQVLCLYSSL